MVSLSVATLTIGFLVGAALVGLQIKPMTTLTSTSSITVTTTQTLLPKQPQAGLDHGYIEIAGSTLPVEIADESHEHGTGLSGRQSLSQGWGMLFIFDKPDRYSFWMYGMMFSLDIIWLDKEGKVVHIVTDAQPCPQQGPCQSYTPGSEALYVLEVSSGFASQQNITVGMSAAIYLRQ